jgi:hypothetical protein
LKIIVSHDVDHLYPSDHILKDLIFPKLWIRSTRDLIRNKISFSTWWFRLTSIFSNRLHMIPEMIEFDKTHSIPSTFFFGMGNCLGMSYSRSKVFPWIRFVISKGFEAGVHGAEFKDYDIMLNEFSLFKEHSGLPKFGIRMHYIRYDSETFRKLSRIGYLFDTSEFNKIKTELKDPYKCGSMWEFPLHIMDGYIIKNNLASAKLETEVILNEGIKKGLKYFTLLFHDYLFNERSYPSHKAYYEWLIHHCERQNLEFISYSEAINELETNHSI